jgi:uncharacterized protein DUF4336
MSVQRVGFELGARMTVVRLPGGLWIHSPIELTGELKQELDRLGVVRFVVAPSRMHYMHVADFARAYPHARLYEPPGFKKQITGVRFHAALTDTPEPEWEGVIDQAAFRGSALYDEVDFFHRPTRTLILTDLCFNIPTDRSWSTRLWAKLLGVLGRLSSSKSFNLTMRDRAAIRASLERILAWDFDRIIISHGAIVETGSKAAFRNAFAWFLEN